MEKNFQNKEALEKLKEIAEDIRVCMYCTMQHSDDVAIVAFHHIVAIPH